MGIAETMRNRVADELAKRSEPWARKLFDPETNAPHPEVVAALAQVAVGLERDAAGSPLANEAFVEQLAAWVVDTVLVSPTVSKVSYRPQFQTGVRVRMEGSGAPMPRGRTLDTLAELALGAYEDTHPRALRIAAPNLIVNEYLRGRETPPARVRRARPASTGGAVAARPKRKGAVARSRGRGTPGRPKASTATKARTAKAAAGSKRTIARAATKQVRRKGPVSGAARAAAARAKARRKKK